LCITIIKYKYTILVTALYIQIYAQPLTNTLIRPHGTTLFYASREQ